MRIKKTWLAFLPLTAASIIGSLIGYGSPQSIFSYLPVICTVIYMVAAFVLVSSEKQATSTHRFEANMISGLSIILLGTLMVVDFFKTMINVNKDGLGYFYILNIILMLLTGVIFIVIGIESIIPRIRRKMRKLPLIMLIPTAYFCTRLVLKFLEYTTSAVASKDMLDLIYIALVVMFIFYYSVLYVGFENKGTVKYIYVFGLGSVMLCLSFNFMYFYDLFRNDISASLNENVRNYEDLLLCVYIISYLFEMTKNVFHINSRKKHHENHADDMIDEDDRRFEKIIEEYDNAENVREGVELEESNEEESKILAEDDKTEISEDDDYDVTDITKIDALINEIFKEDSNN